MAEQQKLFNEFIQPSAASSTDEATDKKQKEGKAKRQKPPKPEKKDPALVKDAPASPPPIACLNSCIGYFPSREQIVQRMVLWSQQTATSSACVGVREEVKELAEILRAELWLESMWQERGGLLAVGDVIIGLFAERPVCTFSFQLGNDESDGRGHPPSPSDSNQLILCRFIGPKRNGLLVEVGVHSDPYFLTWKQAIPLPDRMAECVRSGHPEDVRQVVAADVAVVNEYVK